MHALTIFFFQIKKKNYFFSNTTVHFVKRKISNGHGKKKKRNCRLVRLIPLCFHRTKLSQYAYRHHCIIIIIPSEDPTLLYSLISLTLYTLYPSPIDLPLSALSNINHTNNDVTLNVHRRINRSATLIHDHRFSRHVYINRTLCFPDQ